MVRAAAARERTCGATQTPRRNMPPLLCAPLMGKRNVRPPVSHLYLPTATNTPLTVLLRPCSSLSLWLLSLTFISTLLTRPYLLSPLFILLSVSTFLLFSSSPTSVLVIFSSHALPRPLLCLLHPPSPHSPPPHLSSSPSSPLSFPLSFLLSISTSSAFLPSSCPHSLLRPFPSLVCSAFSASHN